MSRRRVLYLAVLAGSVMAVVLPAFSQATPPGRNGEIAYDRYRVATTTRLEIWVVAPNGSNAHRIVNAPAYDLDSVPSWSPDGSKLLFNRCSTPKIAQRLYCAGHQTIWSVEADGSHLHMLSRPCTRKTSSRSAFARCPDDGQAVYSPDGRRIAYTRYVGIPELAIADSNLRRVRALLPFGRTTAVTDIGAVAWSPDGTRLAFTVLNDRGKRYRPVGGRAVYVVNTDGRGLHRVTPWKVQAGNEVDWSPDGSRIIFDTVLQMSYPPDVVSGQIYTIHPDGTGLQQLTHIPFGDTTQLGSYSPDGSQIVFATQHRATGVAGSAGAPGTDVFVMRADGSNVTPITRTTNWELSPEWGPGG